jgi:diamine N-acetyltransferase
MVEFRKITYDNLEECTKLKLHPEQENFLASNLYSLAEAYVSITIEGENSYTTPYAIYAEDKMVGFILLDYYPEDDIFGENAYHIWRLMIDKDQQGKGYGKMAIEKAIEVIESKLYGPGEYIYVSYDPENEVSRKLFKSFGFVETDKKFNENELEIIARRKI